MDRFDVAATVILHFPTETPRTRTVRGVVSAEIEWGSENTVTLEKVNGTRETFTSNGLTISGFALDGSELEPGHLRFMMDMEKESESPPANREAAAERLRAIADQMDQGFTAGETWGATWDLKQ